jgi:hypothetical protein
LATTRHQDALQSEIKDGKEHRYWNIVESKRYAGAKVVQRQVLYLSKINDSQQQAWGRVIEGFDEKTQQRTQLAYSRWKKGLSADAREAWSPSAS